MNERFAIQISERTGLPFVAVPTVAMWGLVEHLSWQRVAVIYTYENGCFIVRFTHSTPAEAQKVVDEWTLSRAPASANDLVAAGNSGSWVVGAHTVDQG